MHLNHNLYSVYSAQATRRKKNRLKTKEEKEKKKKSSDGRAAISMVYDTARTILGTHRKVRLGEACIALFST